VKSPEQWYIENETILGLSTHLIRRIQEDAHQSGYAEGYSTGHKAGFEEGLEKCNESTARVVADHLT
jgi:flagellar biosynthesis/type III secretory pathway protein FliH